MEDVPLDPTATFEGLRARLFGLAYRMLGSRAALEWTEAVTRVGDTPVRNDRVRVT